MEFRETKWFKVRGKTLKNSISDRILWSFLQKCEMKNQRNMWKFHSYWHLHRKHALTADLNCGVGLFIDWQNEMPQAATKLCLNVRCLLLERKYTLRKLPKHGSNNHLNAHPSLFVPACTRTQHIANVLLFDAWIFYDQNTHHIYLYTTVASRDTHLLRSNGIGDWLCCYFRYRWTTCTDAHGIRSIIFSAQNELFTQVIYVRKLFSHK